MHNFKELSLKHTVSCFMNSLFREYQNFSFEAGTTPEKTAVISVDLENGMEVLIPLSKKSLLGRHEYVGTFYLRQGAELKSVDFNQAVNELLTFLCKHWEQDLSKKHLFMGRLENSLHNMELSLKAREKDIEHIYSGKVSFIEAEQGLMVGHNFHPYPKMREGFDDRDFEIYSPEMGGHFPLHWFFVKPEVLHVQTAEAFATKNWTEKLFQAEGAGRIPEGFIAFPVHPWQRQHLLKNATVQSYFEKGLIVDAGAPSTKSWHPTSSLRSIYGAHSPYMLKFSLTVRLTNSIRHLTDVEVVRGLQVYDVMSTTVGKKFLNENPQFEVIFEPAFAALKTADGKVINESIVVCRENPFQQEIPGEENIVVSTLAQDNPLGGETLIWKQVQKLAKDSGKNLKDASREWFKHYMQVALQPFITAQSEYGILLGAHQQNMILRISRNLPVKAYFRDCQGTGYSEHGYNLYHQDVASLTRENGNILDNKGNILFAYYLLVNSTWNILAALSHPEGASEAQLTADMNDFIRGLYKPNLPDTSFLDYVTKDARIWQKGNFICSLQSLNENTVANPLAIYNLIDNPISFPGALS
ncbi:IucA/IucC family siderophore biosynthesis protein [Bdellovibrio bacteriovorus]|uniref:IucA/IucC family protein n=1 Tax=Bdellovibrio bacteriovorus TaxID=959 RepID=UPI0035A687B6